MDARAQSGPRAVAPAGDQEDSAVTATLSTQSSAPTFSLATLRTVLAELTAEHPDREWRLVKAANIVAVRTIERSPSGPGWWVESESEAGKFYFVLPVGGHDTCSCQDYQRRGGPCKHGLAVELYTRCERRDAEANDPTGDPDNVTPFPERAYSDADRFVLTPKGYAALGDPDPDPGPPAGPPLGP